MNSTPAQTSHKALAGGLAGSVTILVLFFLGQYLDFIEVPSSDLVNQATIALLGAIITFIGTYASVWIKKNYLKDDSNSTRLQSHWLAAFILLPLMFLLTACPTTPPDPYGEIKLACDSYASSLRVVSNALIADELSEEDEARVDTIRSIVGPICNSPTLPTDQMSIRTVQDALTELLIYEGRVQ